MIESRDANLIGGFARSVDGGDRRSKIGPMNGIRIGIWEGIIVMGVVGMVWDGRRLLEIRIRRQRRIGGQLRLEER